MIELLGMDMETKPIRCLLDTGTTKSIILDTQLPINTKIFKSKKPIIWQTLGGSLTTNKLAEINFKIPELSINKTITWKLHIDEVSKWSCTI